MRDPYKYQGPVTGIYPDEDERQYLLPDRKDDPYWHAKYVAYAVIAIYFAGIFGMCVAVRFW